MARHVPGHPQAQTTTTVSSNTRTRRLTSVSPRSGQTLTSAEENVLRMHHGLTVAQDEPLPTNAVTAALRQQLLEIETRAYTATGRAQQEPGGEDEAAPVPSATKSKIVSRLRKP